MLGAEIVAKIVVWCLACRDRHERSGDPSVNTSDMTPLQAAYVRYEVPTSSNPRLLITVRSTKGFSEETKIIEVRVCKTHPASFVLFQLRQSVFAKAPLP